MQNFEFITPSKIVFGAGKLAEAGTLVAPFGKKALIVCDEWTARCCRRPAACSPCRSSAG
jgi:alcohol dehydrogenase class IV